ncbi:MULTISPECIES: hypothetical protein [unclassified Caballeronia]|uniref:hypothetical protein n=1 Tax=unclassified Caballeronia TaxID=2646786 RepID=UPI0020282D91|nr:MULTISPECIES: hypothetical protein [unclassified Caballeronia]MDR5768086.1 hypothetical protein [Caballeronia sp. LZ028]
MKTTESIPQKLSRLRRAGVRKIKSVLLFPVRVPGLVHEVSLIDLMTCLAYTTLCLTHLGI